MEFAQTKIILYCMLIIATGFDLILPWPIFTGKSSSNIDVKPQTIERPRTSRQVVQPKWLNTNNEPAIDPTVHVNPKSLLEADMIRKSIQKAVQQDTYAVTGEETNPNLPMVTVQPAADERNNHHDLPVWYQRMQMLWQNWSQGLLRGLHT